MERIIEIKLSVQTKEFNQELYRTLGNNPDILLQRETLIKLVNLTSSPDNIISYLSVEGNLNESSRKETDTKLYSHSNDQRFLNYWIFNLSDGRTAEIHFINEEYKIEGAPGALITAIIFYMALIGLLSFFTSRKITKPLKKLKDAAINIKNEEFDVDLSYNKVDEIKDVFNAFNEMTIKLKKNAQRQLEYEKNRTELIANISHDLKTPITAIRGYISGIVDGVANTPEKINKYHKTIFKKISLLDKLIENLFLSSKLELKTVPFNFQKLNFNHFIKDIIDELIYDQQKVDISYLSDPSPVFILGDSVQLQRVINNLIDNSVKYCNKECCIISIDYKIENYFLHVSISDNGIGIAPEVSKNIFDQFFRTDPARSSSTEGSGLGLFISKQIINAHSGQISASANINGGLTVTFNLPVLKELT